MQGFLKKNKDPSCKEHTCCALLRSHPFLCGTHTKVLFSKSTHEYINTYVCIYKHTHTHMHTHIDVYKDIGIDPDIDLDIDLGIDIDVSIYMYV